LVALELIVIIPVYDLASVGLNVIVNVLLEFIGIVADVGVIVKPEGIVMPEILMIWFPTLEIVTFFVLVVFISSPSKFKEVGEMLIKNVGSGISSPPDDEQELKIIKKELRMSVRALFFI